MKHGDLIIVILILMILVTGCRKSKDKKSNIEEDEAIEFEEYVISSIPDSGEIEKSNSGYSELIEVTLEELEMTIPNELKNEIREERLITFNTMNIMNLLKDFLANNGYEYRRYFDVETANENVLNKLNHYKNLADDELWEWEIIDFASKHYIIKIGFSPYEGNSEEFDKFVNKINESTYVLRNDLAVVIYDMGDLNKEIDKYLNLINSSNKRRGEDD